MERKHLDIDGFIYIGKEASNLERTDIAETEHNKQKCHLCEDWNGCGRDCTLSKIYCADCDLADEV